MGHAEVGYAVYAPWYPRIDGEYDYASGTHNPMAAAIIPLIDCSVCAVRT